MKKITVIVCGILLIIGLFCGCKNQIMDGDGMINEVKTEFIKGTITEINGNTLTFEVEDASPEKSSTDVFSVPVENSEAYHEGQKIEIEYSGRFLETYPAQFEEIVNITTFTETVEETAKVYG